MATVLELALMAGGAYISTRAPINKISTPTSWVKLSGDPDVVTGFEAVTYIKDGFSKEDSPEIVISFAGTDPKSLADIAADVALFGGRYHAQLLQAAKYYLDIKAANPNAIITLTGHSLGGGLAALVAVFFGESATTFDQAPFASAAKWLVDPDVATTLLNDLQTLYPATPQGDPLQGLRSFIAVRGGTNNFIPNSDKVSNIAVQGEFLSGILSNVLGSRIVGEGKNTTIGNVYDATVGGGDLHSMALLAAYLQSEHSAVDKTHTLNLITQKLSALLGLSFLDGVFEFATDPTNTTQTNFWEHLVRHEAGVKEGDNAGTAIAADAMVKRFTADLWKLAQDGGLTVNDGNTSNADLNEISKALIAFAMQKYYRETDHTKELFTAIDGGVSFKRTDVAANWGDTKGKQYIEAYLAQGNNGLSEVERNIIAAQMPELIQWFVQAGTQGMNATAGHERAFMLGGQTNDVLVGGGAADLLVGNQGSDLLMGARGYTVANLFLGVAGQANTWQSADDQFTLTHGATWQLTFSGPESDWVDTLYDSSGNDHLHVGVSVGSKKANPANEST